MDFSFIRKLVKAVSELEVRKIYQMLTVNGIEVFIKMKDGFSNMTLEDVVESGELYVSAADLSYAREVVETLGLGQYLCDETEANENVGKSEVEKAEEEFYRKHKQNQIFAWVIIAGVIVFMMMQFFVK